MGTHFAIYHVWVAIRDAWSSSHKLPCAVALCDSWAAWADWVAAGASCYRWSIACAYIGCCSNGALWYIKWLHPVQHLLVIRWFSLWDQWNDGFRCRQSICIGWYSVSRAIVKSVVRCWARQMAGVVDLVMILVLHKQIEISTKSSLKMLIHWSYCSKCFYGMCKLTFLCIRKHQLVLKSHQIRHINVQKHSSTNMFGCRKKKGKKRWKGKKGSKRLI